MSEPASLRVARHVLRELVAAGVKHIVLSPGSRSAPLAYVCDDFPFQVTVRLDERSAAFTALGMAMATGRPAVVITTSGSAVANLFPALTEADAAAVPLIALTADRPRHLWNTGANQTTRQYRIFEPITRASFQLDSSDAAETVAHTVRAAHAEAVGQSTATDAPGPADESAAACGSGPVRAPGPVHINLSFDIPLTPPLDDAEDQRTPGGGSSGLNGRPEHPGYPNQPSQAHQLCHSNPVPRAQISGGSESEAAAQLRALLHSLPQPLVVAGDKADLTPGVSALADSGVPLIAEPSSNLRHLPNALPGGPRILVENPQLVHEIGAIITVGHPTLNRPVTALLTDPSRPQYVWCDHDRATRLAGSHTQRRFPSTSQMERPPSSPLHSMTTWAARWEQAAATLPTIPITPYDRAALAVWEHATAQAEQLLIGASSAIRSLDSHLPGAVAGPARVWANRGLAGIDGTISAGWGIALGTGHPTRVICGDLTFLHDISALNYGKHEQMPDLCVVVLNDHGGSIFDGLEHGERARTSPRAWERFERYFLTPQRTHLARAAHGFGVRVHSIHMRDCDDAELRQVLALPIAGLSVVVVNLPNTTRA